MSDPFTKPFTKAEMEAMREATRDEEGLKRRFWDKLKRVAGKVPFAEDLVAAFFCATDPSTPSRVTSSAAATSSTPCAVVQAAT